MGFGNCLRQPKPRSRRRGTEEVCLRTGGRRDRPGSHASSSPPIAEIGDKTMSQELVGEPTQIMRRYLSHFGDETDNLVGHLTAALEISEKDYDIKSANQT